MYCEHITIVNDDSSVVNKFEASLTDDTRVVIDDHHMFIVQAAGFIDEHSSLLRLECQRGQKSFIVMDSTLGCPKR